MHAIGEEALELSARSAEPDLDVFEDDTAIHREAIDARVLALFDDAPLRQKIRRMERLELAEVRRLSTAALARQRGKATPSAVPMALHRRVMAGLAGETLLISASLFLDTLAQAEQFFGLSFKTLKARLGTTLVSAEGELALRAARVALTAAAVLGSHEAAREYMHTRNFALGGAVPADLVRSAEGERIVLNELQAQAEGGPL